MPQDAGRPPALEYHELSEDAVGMVRTWSGPLATGAKEPAGTRFHEAALRARGLLRDPSSDSSSSDGGGAPDSSRPSSAGGGGASTDADMQPPPGVSWKRSKSKRKGKETKKEVDYYALLGLANERWTATDAQIKLAYRRTSLVAHPDKALQGVTDPEEKTRIEDVFKRIQEAYEVLSDPAKRREYDSTDEFDDTLPSGCDPADFFKVFGPAFRRNARWSVDPKVPDVGSPDAPWDEVAAFYDFWFVFKSWREFPHPDEEDIEAAEGRDHRRWIERYNSKLREKAKKEEAKRLREFVDAAQRTDPRVAARREEERAERERKKAEKEAAKRAAEEAEEQRRAAEEAARLAAEEAAKRAAAEAKVRREAEKKALKKERQRLRALAGGGSTGSGGRLLSDDDTEKLCATLDTAALAALSDAASAEGLSPDERAAILAARFAELAAAEAAAANAKEQQKLEAAAALKDLAKRDHERRMAGMTPWTDEELRLLDKACNKFPMGTPKRWEAVAAFVRTRDLDEVLLMVKERQGAASNRLRQQEDWKGAAKKRAEVKAEADSRDCAFTDVQVTLVRDASSDAGGSASAGGGVAAVDSSSTGGGGGDGGGDGGSSGGAGVPGSSGVGASVGGDAAAPAGAGSSGGGAGPKKVVSAASGEWSEAQELALVQALKAYGKELPDRWDRIAGAVVGKTKAQCMRRFKELKEAFKAKAS